MAPSLGEAEAFYVQPGQAVWAESGGSSWAGVVLRLPADALGVWTVRKVDDETEHQVPFEQLRARALFAAPAPATAAPAAEKPAAKPAAVEKAGAKKTGSAADGGKKGKGKGKRKGGDKKAAAPKGGAKKAAAASPAERAPEPVDAMMAVLSEAVGSALGDLNIDPAALKAAQDGAAKDTRPWLQTQLRSFANSATAASAQAGGHVPV